MHDTIFKRTTCINLNEWDADYEMIQNLNASEYYNNDMYREKIPTLEEFLINTKVNINLMIELKTTEYDNNIEESVIDLIKNLICRINV